MMKLIWKKLKTYSALVMFEHTAFALPFSYLALFLAAEGWPSFYNFFWVTIAMIGARNGANAWNRLADMKIDKKNPRTAERHLPSGEVSPREVLGLTVFCFGLLVLAAFKLNSICVYLLPVAIFIVVFYSYTKRFTWMCHLFLGAADALAPVGTWIAVTGGLSWGVLIIGLIQALWIAGFDVIYGTQDYEFDIKEGVHSIPARFGVKKALKIAQSFHFLTIVLLISLYFFFPLGSIYFIGIFLITILLIHEHKLVSPDDLSQVKIASYSINQIIGPLLFLTTMLDIIIF